MPDATFESDLRFYVNGNPVVVRDVDPTVLLVDWLRSPDVGLTGTKKGCDQGGCGACTIMLSSWNDETKTVDRRAVNSCLRPICTLDGMEVTTTEGTGSSRTSLSPVQYRIAKENGTQCGYCTPGFVMNMYSFLASNPGGKPTQDEIEGIFDGNICRCTGYHSILYGMRHFASDWSPADEKDCLVTVVDPAEVVPVQDAINPIFPAALEKAPRAVHYERDGFHWYRPLTLAGVHEILRQHPDSKNVRLVVGNTSIGVYSAYVENPHVLIDVSHVPELYGITHPADGITVGAATTYSDFLRFLDVAVVRAPEPMRAGLEAMRFMGEHTAGMIVRNAASLAGNTMLAVRHVNEGDPFPSDMFTAFSALGTEIEVSVGDTVRCMPILDFAAEYQTSSELRDHAVLLRYRVPATRANEWVRCYKTALRKENAHSIVNAGIRVRFDDDTVAEASIILGGIGPIAFHAALAEAELIGKAWTNETLNQALLALRRDVELNLEQNRERMSSLLDEGFSDIYKLHLAEGYFYQFWVWVAGDGVPANVRSAGARTPRPVTKGTQNYEKDTSEYPVNLPMIKLGAFLQASGEAIYTHDLPLPRLGYEGAAVTSMSALANISYKIPSRRADSLDDSAARRLDDSQPATIDELVTYLQGIYPGFFDYVTARDVPNPSGAQHTSGAIADPIFAGDQVTSYGQLIGVVLAEDEQLAQRIANFIATQCIEYAAAGDPILTFDDALAQNSIYPDVPYFPNHIWKVQRPNSELAWADGAEETEVNSVACRVVRGMQQAGSQLHYYMETHSALALPGEANQMVIHASTQSPDSIHSDAAQALGVPTTAIDVRVDRVGGGYGGKTTRSRTRRRRRPWRRGSIAVRCDSRCAARTTARWSAIAIRCAATTRSRSGRAPTIPTIAAS